MSIGTLKDPVNFDHPEITYFCPQCGHTSRLLSVGGPMFWSDSASTPKPADLASMAKLYQCKVCSHPVLILGDNIRIHSTINVKPDDGLRMFPPNVWVGSDSIPPDIREAMAESATCLSMACWNAAALLIRRAVEMTCNDRGAKGRSLQDKIDDLAAKSVLTPLLAELSHGIRFIGNTSAHGDDLSVISGEDATTAFDFAEQLLEYVFVMPAKSGRIQQKFQSRTK